VTVQVAAGPLTSESEDAADKKEALLYRTCSSTSRATGRPRNV